MFAGRLHVHVRRVADPYFRGQRFGYRNAQTEHVYLRDGNHRQTAGIRGPGLDQRAGIGEAPGDHAIVRSGDASVVVQRGIVLLIGARDFQLLLGGCERRLGGLDLRLRGAILRGGIVEFLLRDQSGPRFVGIDQAVGVRMQRHIVGLRAQHVTLRTLDFFFGVVHGSLGFIDLGNHFGNFQHRQHLSLMDVVANINVDRCGCSRRPSRAVRHSDTG